MTQQKLPKLNGWKRSTPNPNAPKFTGIRPVFQTNDVIDLRQWCSPIENQGDIGSCCANATVSALELLRIKNGKPHLELSRLFLYYNTRLMHGDQDHDAGSIISLAIGSLNTIGTCEESLWPYDTNKIFLRPSWKSYREAYGNKIGHYETIPGTGQSRVDACVNALTGGYPIVFGMDVDQAFTANKDPSFFFTGLTAGTHAMCIVGWNKTKQEFIVRNSWGDSWGDNGYWYMHKDVLDQQNASDFWVLYESPELLQHH